MNDPIVRLGNNTLKRNTLLLLSKQEPLGKGFLDRNKKNHIDKRTAKLVKGKK